MRKLDLAKRRDKEDRAVVVSQLTIDQPETIKAMEETREAVKELWQLINDKEDYDFDKLEKQLESLHSKLDFQPIIDQLKTLNGKEIGQLQIEGFTDLIKKIEQNKPLKIDLEPLRKAIIEVQQRIQDNVVDPSQAAEDFQPFRRVIKVGNKLIYDDQPTPSRGGGGSSSSTSIANFPSDYPLPTSQLDVLTPAAKPSSPTVTSVDDSATSVTLIAANSSRKEVEFFNLSSANLYIRKGTTAATTSSGGFTIRLTQYGYYRTDYTGAFRGIWDAGAGGAVSITEST